MKLLNSREELLATFIHVKAASNYWGCFQTASLVAEGGQRLVDEILLSGVALLEYERRLRNISAVAGVVGEAGGGAGAALG